VCQVGGALALLFPRLTAPIDRCALVVREVKNDIRIGKSESCKLAAQRTLSPTLSLVQKWVLCALRASEETVQESTKTDYTMAVLGVSKRRVRHASGRGCAAPPSLRGVLQAAAVLWFLGRSKSDHNLETRNFANLQCSAPPL
jgi:hypothetical protein